MRVRENTGAEQCLTFVDGHSIMLGAGEISRELSVEEISDPYFAKAKHARRVVEYREPQPPAATKKEKPEPETKPEPGEVITKPEPEQREGEKPLCTDEEKDESPKTIVRKKTVKKQDTKKSS